MNRRHARATRTNAPNSTNGAHRLPLDHSAAFNLQESDAAGAAAHSSAADAAVRSGAGDAVRAGAVVSPARDCGAASSESATQTGGDESSPTDSQVEKTVPKKPSCIVCQRTELVGAGYAELIKEAVEVVGYTSDGKEAIELCRELQPALLITDMDLDNIDGLELCRTIRYEQPNIKLLLLSDPYNASRYYAHFLNAGVSTFCLFSSEPQSLLDAIERALKGQHYFDEKLKLWINLNANRNEESTRGSISKEFAVAELIARIALSAPQLSALPNNEASR